MTADDKTKLLGSADPAFTYQVSGLLAGQTAAGVLTGALGRDAGESVGTYATIPIKIRLCSATGANASNSATVVTAVSLALLSSSATQPRFLTFQVR